MNYENTYRLPFGVSEKTADDWKYAAFLFVLGSVAGWCLELAFRSISRGYLFIPGFLIGPYCPIYGFGLVIINFLCRHRNPLMAYLKTFVLTSGLEYLFAFISEDFFGLRLWDYSNQPLNIGGRVSLLFSLAWGGLGLAFLLFAEPKLRAVFKERKRPVMSATTVGIGLVIADTIISVAIM